MSPDPQITQTLMALSRDRRFFSVHDLCQALSISFEDCEDLLAQYESEGLLTRRNSRDGASYYYFITLDGDARPAS